ncbi:MAG: class I SAM-dependent methyltransferase [Acidimicrobiales bacterium]|nr:class I SAM-dependent methyltransferase [Acidimicrobiales bacterium]
MAEHDRELWNDRYRGRAAADGAPSDFVASLDDVLPSAGRALDVAGGAGADAVLLAERGLTVTLLDVSDEALRLARDRATAHGVTLSTVRLDLEAEPPPPGPWDVILVRHYLQRPLLPRLGDLLAPGGLLCVCIATRRNLERHPRPSARFLLEPGELPGLVPDLEIVRWVEDWTDESPDGRHEGRLVARMPDSAA